MTRAIAVLTLSVLTAVLVAPVVAAAQTAPTPAPPAPANLAEVAKAEEARRKSVRKATKVYTNNDLKPDNTTVRPAPAAAAATAPTAGAAVVDLPGGGEPAAAAPETRNEAYWNGRINAARAAVERSKVLAEALQSRINALTTDFVNRDDPAQRAVIETNRKTALAELDRVRKDVEAQTKEIAAIEDEARRAGVPSGWLRPGA